MVRWAGNSVPAHLQENPVITSAHLTGPRWERSCWVFSRAWARVPPQSSAAERSEVCQRPFRSGPGRLPRPAWPAAWWFSGCRCAVFGGPPSQGGGKYFAAALARAPPRWPVAAVAAFPRPATPAGVAPAPPAHDAGPVGAGRSAISGPGLWCPGPPAVGRRSALAASARARSLRALLGRVPLPPPCGRAPNGWPAAAAPAGEAAGAASGPKVGPL